MTDSIAHAVAYGQTAAILFVAALLAGIGLRFRQPLIISFLLAGLLVGPSGIGLISGPAEISLLAHIGISLLLFVVGLRLDLGMIRTVGPAALATGLGQVAFTSLAGFGLCAAFGMDTVTALYVSVALTFSSTIIIVKLLSDKREIDSLHGRIAVGFLLVQDVVAILALIGLTALGGPAAAAGSMAGRMAGVLLRGVGLLVVLAALARWVLPRLLEYLSRSQELLALASVAWAVLLSAAGEALGFSREVGAFLAGVSLASTSQRDAIAGRLVVLRDFLLLFFFVDLGSRLDVGNVGADLPQAAVFSLFVLLGNPLIVMAIMGFMGYRRRTAFMCGLAVAQISEFSLILGALGVSLGHIGGQALHLITLVGLITIFASTYLILYSGPIYARLSGPLRIFERRLAHRESEGVAVEATAELVVLVGLGSYGTQIALDLRRRGRRVLAVDFDPASLERCRRNGIAVTYGDAGDVELLEQLPLRQARWVVSSVRDLGFNRALLGQLRSLGYGGRIAVAAARPDHAEALRAAGADVVLEPFGDAAEQATEVLTGPAHSLPTLAGWAAVLREMPLPTGSPHAGQTLRQLNLRAALGVTVLAVSRAGRVHYNPPPEQRLYPGDRLLLLGAPDAVHRGVELLGERDEGDPTRQIPLQAAQLEVEAGSALAGRSLAELRLREEHGITVIGLRRGRETIHSPHGSQRLQPGDRLAVVGQGEAVERCRFLGAVGPTAR